MRVPGIGTDMFIDRDVERDCMIQAAKAGVGPAVAYQIDPEGALVIDFVEGEIMHPETMAGHADRIKQAVETVRVFHKGCTFKHDIHLFDMLRKYTKIAARHQRPDAGTARGDARGHGGRGEGDDSGTPFRPSPATTTCSPRTSSSTPTARCGSSTGSTAA